MTRIEAEVERGGRMASRLPDPALVDTVVTELRQIERRSGIDRTLAIGELILSKFFGGDPAFWRDRRRNKNNSIRRLANRDDCPFCKSALNEAVAVYVAVRELPCVRTFSHIGASHVASVLKLPEDQRSEILERAEREHLSVRELRKQIVWSRRVGGERRGRPALSPLARMLGEIESDVRKLASAVACLQALGERDAEDRQRLARVGKELSVLMADVDALAGAHPELASIRPGPAALRQSRAV